MTVCILKEKKIRYLRKRGLPKTTIKEILKPTEKIFMNTIY